jgi:hypothetical protein
MPPSADTCSGLINPTEVPITNVIAKPIPKIAILGCDTTVSNILYLMFMFILMIFKEMILVLFASEATFQCFQSYLNSCHSLAK